MIRLITTDYISEILNYLDRDKFTIDRLKRLPDVVIGKSYLKEKTFNNMSDVYYLDIDAGDSIPFPLYCMPNLIDLKDEISITQKNKLVKSGINTPVLYSGDHLKNILSFTHHNLDKHYVLSLARTSKGYGKWLMSKRNLIKLATTSLKFKGELEEFIRLMKNLSTRYCYRETAYDNDNVFENIHERLLKALTKPEIDDPLYLMECITDNINVLEYVREFRVYLFKSPTGVKYIIKKREISPFTKNNDEDTYMYTDDVLNNDYVKKHLIHDYSIHPFLKDVNAYVKEKLIPFFNTKLDRPFVSVDLYIHRQEDNKLDIGVFEYSSVPHISYPPETTVQVDDKVRVSINWTHSFSKLITDAMLQHIKEMNRKK